MRFVGFDAASDVAELVARAFSNNVNIRDRQSSGENNIEPGEDGGGFDNDASGNDPSASSSSDGNFGAGKDESGFMGNILRVIGLDSGKLGALAINGIIFIAQMVGFL